MSRHSVLIADDDAAIRGALRLVLDGDPELSVVGEAQDGDEAVELALKLCPDVILMDVQMPKMSGLEATRMLCARANGPRTIMLTMFDLDEYVYEAIRAGACGFLLKNSPAGAIRQSIHAVCQGASLLDPEITRRLVRHFAPLRTDPLIRSLTARERETLVLVGQGKSNDEIAAEMFITPTTSRTYVSRLLSKLGARDRAQLVVAAYESGLVKND